MYKVLKERKHGTIKNFEMLPPSSLTTMKEDLGLYMTEQELASLQKSFSSHGCTSLSLDGLYLLDSLSAQANIYPERTIIGELRTNDRATMETYSDLVTKRKEISGGKDEPITLLHALSTSGEYLRLCGKKLPLSATLAASVEGDAAQRACSGLTDDGDGFHALANGEYSFGVYKKAPSVKPTCESGDIIAIMLPHDGESKDDFTRKAIEFFSDAQISANICNAAKVEECGLLPSLLHYRSGIDVNLRKYPMGTRELCYADYAASLSGCYTFVIRAQNIQAVAAAAKRMSARVFCAATFTSAGLFRIIDGNEVLLSLPISFLLDACFRSVRALTPNEEAAVFFPCPTTLECRNSPAILSKADCRNALTHGSFISSATAASFEKSFFRSAVYTVLGSVTKLVAAGCDRRQAMISCDVSVAESLESEVLSDTLSLFLGIYRAQTELSLPSSGSKLSFTPSLSGARLAVFATANSPKVQINDTLQDADSNIYLLSARINEDGVPDFDDVRRMYDLVHRLCENGNILSARALTGDLITATLDEMTSDKVSYALLDGADTRLSPVSVIVESKESVDGGVLIASCASAKASDVADASDEDASDTYSRVCSSIYRETPSVLLLSFEKDGKLTREASIITEMFNACGAVASALDAGCDNEGLGRISARIREADVTVFIGDCDAICSALASKRISFALNEYKNDGRLVISYGEGAASAFAAAGIVDLPGEPTVCGSNISVRSLNTSSAFLSSRFSYKCKYLSDIGAVCRKPPRKQLPKQALIAIDANGISACDGFLSKDKLAASFVSILPEEIVESVVNYFR